MGYLILAVACFVLMIYCAKMEEDQVDVGDVLMILGASLIPFINFIFACMCLFYLLLKFLELKSVKNVLKKRLW